MTQGRLKFNKPPERMTSVRTLPEVGGPCRLLDSCRTATARHSAGGIPHTGWYVASSGRWELVAAIRSLIPALPVTRVACAPSLTAWNFRHPLAAGRRLVTSSKHHCPRCIRCTLHVTFSHFCTLYGYAPNERISFLIRLYPGNRPSGNFLFPPVTVARDPGLRTTETPRLR